VCAAQTFGLHRETGTHLSMDIIRIIIAIFLPPVAVFTQVGLGKHFWINCLLTLCGWLPGVIHALYVIGKY
jgi:uncharacterized membrane protein YqaE (UPF0057 family)